MSDQPWPKDPRAVNQWNLDASSFLAKVQQQPLLWLFDHPLKYLEMRVDTRDGGFVLFDRDRQRIEPGRVLRAIERATEEFGHDDEGDLA